MKKIEQPLQLSLKHAIASSIKDSLIGFTYDYWSQITAKGSWVQSQIRRGTFLCGACVHSPCTQGFRPQSKKAH